MKISAMQEYGLRCILQVAAHKGPAPLTVRDIAKAEGLTPVYVAKILVNLRKAGLVNSVRGVLGGYVLARPAKDISVAQALGALGHLDMGKNHCKRFTGNMAVCTHMENCGIRPVLSVLAQHIYGFLSQMNLAQLVQDETAVAQQVALVQNRLPVHPFTQPAR